MLHNAGQGRLAFAWSQRTREFPDQPEISANEIITIRRRC